MEQAGDHPREQLRRMGGFRQLRGRQRRCAGLRSIAGSLHLLPGGLGAGHHFMFKEQFEIEAPPFHLAQQIHLFIQLTVAINELLSCLPQGHMDPDAGHYNFCAERFGDVIDRSGLEPFDQIIRGIQSTDKNDGDIEEGGGLLRLSAELKSVHAGHPDVQQNNVRP